MSVLKAIYKREMGSYFGTPIAYVFMVIFVFLTGIFTFKIAGFYENGQADLRAFFFWHPWIYLFLAPSVSMRLWAEERKSGTLELLLSLPVKPSTAVIAKFLAAWTFIAVNLLLTFPLVLTVMYLGDPDMGVILAGYMGSFFMAGAYIAIGSSFSAASKNQIVSFIMTVVSCLSLILIGYTPFIKFFSGVFPDFILEQMRNLSFIAHFDSIQKGVLDLRDLIFFASLIACGLYASLVILEEKKSE
ncbi:MAG: ABC transporter permease [Candidatus Aureabacteria bacterium]|nr:ABC transporter permease [Candidatus Auribacterota bacterium]